jgi:arylsulfatase A-like enzyme
MIGFLKTAAHSLSIFLSATLWASERPNILFVAVDDLRPALGCYGDKTAVTPNLDKLAREGILFERTYCQLAVCSPSRLSLMTGRRPDSIRVWDLGTHFRKAVPDAVTLPQLFKQNGYHTRSIGKILHGSGSPSKDPVSWSVDPVHEVNRDPRFRYATARNLKGKGLKRSASASAEVPDGTYMDGLICEEAEKALRQHGENSSAKDAKEARACEVPACHEHEFGESCAVGLDNLAPSCAILPCGMHMTCVVNVSLDSRATHVDE